MTNRPTIVTARNAAQRAFADWRTILAARSGVRSLRCADAGAENRSVAGSGADDGTGAGRRSSGGRPGWSVIGLLGGAGGCRAALDAAGGRTRRLDAGLPDGDGQRAQGDLAGVDRQDPVVADLDAEAVHPARRGAVLRACRLDAQPVVARPVARALEPEVLEARVGLAAEMRAALVQRADVDVRPVAGGVLARNEPLLAGVDEDDERLGGAVVGGEALVDRQRGVGGDHLVQGADPDLAPELALEVRPQEPDGPGRHLEQPQAHARGERPTQELPARDALDLVVTDGLEGLRGKGLRLVRRLDVVVAHDAEILRLTGRSAGPASRSRRTRGTG